MAVASRRRAVRADGDHRAEHVVAGDRPVHGLTPPLRMLVCDPPGAGSSSLVRELARLHVLFASEMNGQCQKEDKLLKLHVEEETNSKTLLGL